MVNQTSEQRSDSIRHWIDSAAKLMAAVSVIVATIAASYIGLEYESKMTSVSLLSQREDAESKIRSSMFQSLAGPLVQLSQDNKFDPERYRVLVNLLALNFHDQFEVKPLLIHADKLQGSNQAGRDALREVARRVIDREIFSLTVSSRNGQDPARMSASLKFCEHYIPFSEAEESALPAGCFQGLESSSNKLYEWAALPSTDGEYDLNITVQSIDRESSSARIGIRACKADATTPTADICTTDVIKDFSFTLTHFDFPLTDNTHIDTDHRFAVSMYSLKPGLPLIIRVVWFPNGFVTARERPMNYSTLREDLGIAEAH